jgi:hypothetical protein
MLLAALEVGHQVVHVHGVRLEGATGRQMKVADAVRNELQSPRSMGDGHFVDSDAPSYVAAFCRLLFDLLGPAFLDALSSPSQSIPHINLDRPGLLRPG